ncbi:ABC-2 type transport system ATP-binding protein [Paenibacillus endophyticus]|uniref:ABC-2 type transport system ATP-binding protein n=1 Tax=Paenibacillus endophyticus TaxID=1294268 RepID=A0A7W5C773_9BACL|nr:ABC transporter ATP-binding protein [Paenibacillus endophyticus]MBB3152376.1 ABC-2 type transport system ATP-binding protein [Paenibacillus endophyticus]
MMTLGIEVNNLQLKYGSFAAIKNVTFSLAGGRIYGLLGRNGSGKTSLLSILASYREQTNGQVTIGGEAPFENAKIMEQVCFIQESGSFSDSSSVSDVLRLSASCWPNWDSEYAAHLIALYDLPLKKLVSALSRGMKSALGVTIGLASRAPVTIFDEAYLGMDAPSRYAFYDELLKDYMETPRTFIISTHLIEEVGSLFEEVLILDQGRLIMHEETDVLKSRGASITGSEQAVDQITEGLTILGQQMLGRTKSVTVFGELTEEHRKHALALGLELGPVSLQDLFVHLTKKEGLSNEQKEKASRP